MALYRFSCAQYHDEYIYTPSHYNRNSLDTWLPLRLIYYAIHEMYAKIFILSLLKKCIVNHFAHFQDLSLEESNNDVIARTVVAH